MARKASKSSQKGYNFEGKPKDIEETTIHGGAISITVATR